MSSSILYMSMSLDGFIAGSADDGGNGLENGGERLHEWPWTGADADHEGVPADPPGVDGSRWGRACSTSWSSRA